MLDNYSPEFLLFWRASPLPTSINTVTCELRWDDLLPLVGRARLRPGELLTVTTVFTALKSVDGAVINRAGAIEVRDEFGNAVEAPRQTEIPIRVLPGPGEATATPKSRPRDNGPSKQPTPTPTATVATPSPPATAPSTATPEMVSTSTPEGVTATPASLPRTGAASAPGAWLLFGLALFLGGTLALLHRRRSGN